MIYSVLADVVLLLHLSFIVFAVLGGLLLLRWRSVAWLHLPAVIWGVSIEFTGQVCPLTPLENWLRGAAGSSGYEDGFIEHYLLPVIYPPALTRDTQLLMAAFLGLANVAVYLFVWRRGRRASAPRTSA